MQNRACYLPEAEQSVEIMRIDETRRCCPPLIVPPEAELFPEVVELVAVPDVSVFPDLWELEPLEESDVPVTSIR